MQIKRREILISSVLILLLAFTLKSSIYYFPGESGSVVHEDDGAPVPGAVVVKAWSNHSIGIEIIGPEPHEQFALKEAVTDEEGLYQFKPFIDFHWPFVIYFEDERYPRTAVITDQVYLVTSTKRSKIIKLPKFQSNAEKLGKISSLQRVVIPKESTLCAADHIPEALSLLDRHGENLSGYFLKPLCDKKKWSFGF